VLLVVMAGGLAAVTLAPPWWLPPAPIQPMAFSHRVHAGEQRIGCTACHPYAERSPVAGLPPMALCQGCHRFVKEDRERPQLARALKPLLAWLKKRPPEPIPWVRVHRLPDHVVFTHQRHLAGGVKCQACHGEVEKMDRLRQAVTLEMGWCLDCHRRKQAEPPAGRAHLTECLTCHK